MMLRGILIVATLLLLLTPPGVCLCGVGHADESSSHEEDEHHAPGCPAETLGRLAVTTAAIDAPAPDLAISDALRSCEDFVAHAAPVEVPALPPPDIPLYLAKTSLLI